MDDAKASVITHRPTFIIASPENRRAAEIGITQVDTSTPTPTIANILAAQRRLDELMRQTATGRGMEYDF
ncbi:hypothetical protein N7540_012229 [Penicillium herquei]|nr:hypothetical protein N7540_012229 [Penicillium herquei]